MSSQQWTIFLVKQGNFKVGVVPADGLGRLLLKHFFIKWNSPSVMSAAANPMNFWLI
jgi:hypothetical protein